MGSDLVCVTENPSFASHVTAYGLRPINVANAFGVGWHSHSLQDQNQDSQNVLLFSAETPALGFRGQRRFTIMTLKFASAPGSNLHNVGSLVVPLDDLGTGAALHGWLTGLQGRSR